MEYLIYNGKIIQRKEFVLSPFDRAFNYGDGLFETIIYKDNTFQYLNDHFTRIQKGLNCLAIEFPLELTILSFMDLVKELLIKNELKSDARIKLVVWRKEGGVVTPEHVVANYCIIVSPIVQISYSKEKVFISTKVKLFPNELSKFKTLNFLPYILAGIEKKERKCDDLILLNHENAITETISANIFWIKDYTVYTPSLQTGCIEGIMRKQIINYCLVNNITVCESVYFIKDLLEAETVFTSNVSGLSLITEIDGNVFESQLTVFQSIKLALNLL